MFVRAYLRASTEDQNANRARDQLDAFAAERGLVIAAYYVENASGAKLERPELLRMLSDCKKGDILLIEQVDRLSRLNQQDWETLRRIIHEKGIVIVALDLPTSWSILSMVKDDITARIMGIINNMLLDLLAAFARKDYEDRRRRQAQGIASARKRGAFKGRQANKAMHDSIVALLEAGTTWSQIMEVVGCSHTTVARINRQLKENKREQS